MKRARAGIGVVLLGGVALWALSGSSSKKAASRALPSDGWQTTPDFTEADVEAAARMIASENPRGSRELHIEQVWTQLRARKPGQSLFDRITNGLGFGPQGEKEPGRGERERPVATENSASADQRQFAREVLAGKYTSKFAGARRFFEPAVSDLAFAIGERARAKMQRGEALTAQERRLLKYKRDAQAVRDKWQNKDRLRKVGALEGVEFWT
jgi:hypothetical protein